MTLPPIPDDVLRNTYKREQPYRHHWPESYEAGMADPIISRIVELLARHAVPAWGRRHADRARVGLGSIAPTSPAPGLAPMSRPLAPGEVDRKRAASGDRDDED